MKFSLLLSFFLIESLLLISSSVKAAEKQVLTDSINRLLKNFHTIGSSDLSCHLDDSCPLVHVEPWCKEQYELLQNAPKLETNPLKQNEKKSIVFLSEEHGDEQAYSYYEKLLSDSEADFDCLFLEFPSVFQKNFDSKKGIIHDNGKFTRLDRNIQKGEITQISIRDLNYIELLERLISVAREKNIKVHLVDNSLKEVTNTGVVDALVLRNKAMAKNISEAFESRSCHKGISIKGAQHLFAQNESLESVDQILKKQNTGLKVKKAMIYSPSSKLFNESMGPCSWINILPQSEESYYSRDFFKNHRVFPSKITSQMEKTYSAQIKPDVDFAIILPAQVDSSYLISKFNGNENKPKKFKTVESLSLDVKDIPMELRTNALTMGVSGVDGVAGICSKKCYQQGKHSKFILKDISYSAPSIKCHSFHPSRTNGAPFAPILHLNAKLSGDCYCTSDY